MASEDPTVYRMDPAEMLSPSSVLVDPTGAEVVVEITRYGADRPVATPSADEHLAAA
ncbi:hypothetical protein HC031_22625 [Planosporangium thailandense]|uniref:Uncharacterized protein n=1 Tax=Planosporangium thailandense TaxID=765197 RepID=A0ABX0Y520_9ACTN|nr:hypothetical protein [Planosporangium thailandense]NJC72492.1 hypothetical protein [Planosporangium thailandense]